LTYLLPLIYQDAVLASLDGQAVPSIPAP